MIERYFFCHERHEKLTRGIPSDPEGGTVGRGLSIYILFSFLSIAQGMNLILLQRTWELIAPEPEATPSLAEATRWPDVGGLE